MSQLVEEDEHDVFFGHEDTYVGVVPQAQEYAVVLDVEPEEFRALGEELAQGCDAQCELLHGWPGECRDPH